MPNTPYQHIFGSLTTPREIYVSQTKLNTLYYLRQSSAVNIEATHLLPGWDSLTCPCLFSDLCIKRPIYFLPLLNDHMSNT